ncbi:MAG: hypothetical protein JO005_15765 [Gammaproteobacteria bacterium]|nr:hypothetical protein [Gammaproteobacteria bacterium]
MKVFSVAAVCAAALLPALVHAETAPGAQLLGSADALANFCSRVDPGNGRRFEGQVLGILGLSNLPEDAAERARRDPQYRTAYQLFESVLNEQTAAAAQQACAKLLAQAVPHPNPDPDPKHAPPDKRHRK